MVEEEDVHVVRQFRDAFGDQARAARGQTVGGVHEVQPAARGAGRPRRAGSRVAGPLRQRDHQQVRGVAPGRLLGPGADGGDDHLHVAVGVAGEGVQQPGQPVLRVRPVDDDAELGHRKDSFTFVIAVGHPARP
ncbi:hypothetical protein ACFXDP_15260 [Streptomyces sp. NPDC059374]|uniref:hypothetical protein n=1 Tax=Streptomyces sp. NPDC059374 TaxID=3346814 RepID=UPI0036C9A159